MKSSFSTSICGADECRCAIRTIKSDSAGISINHPQLVNVRLAPTLPVLGSLVFERGFAIWVSEEQHQEDSSVAKLLRLSLTTLTFLVLLDDPVNELFLSGGLGSDCILGE
jgi:hypothetical protein